MVVVYVKPDMREMPQRAYSELFCLQEWRHLHYPTLEPSRIKNQCIRHANEILTQRIGSVPLPDQLVRTLMGVRLLIPQKDIQINHSNQSTSCSKSLISFSKLNE
jgi:hypothetical protein